MENPYRPYVVPYLARLLSLQDDNPFSPTYGCFDRNFWHYKFITDYPSSRYQEAVLSLTLLYLTEFTGNFCYQNQSIYDRICAGIKFWYKIQHQDGSFDEAYPYERSYVATAFSLNAITESVLLLKKANKLFPYEWFVPIEKAARWLSQHNDWTVANHTAGAVTAVYNTYLLTGSQEFKSITEKKVNLLLNQQDKEGWFPEYGGADLGYLSLTIEYLSLYYSRSKDTQVKTAISRAIEFMLPFIHPDGTFAGDYGSRNTDFLYPGGLEYFGKENPNLPLMLNKYYTALNKNLTPHPGILDDRYFCFTFSSYLRAMCEFSRPGKSIEQQNPYRSVYFASAGLVTFVSSLYYLIASTKKPGVLKVWALTKEHIVLSDAGYLGYWNNRLVTSQYLHFKTKPEIFKLDETQCTIETKTKFCVLPKPPSLDKFIIPLRLINYTLGRIPVLNHLMNIRLKNRLFKTRRKIAVQLHRKINCNSSTIVVEDYIVNLSDKPVTSLKLIPYFVPQHISYSRYNYPNQLNIIGINNLPERLNPQQQLYIHRKIEYSPVGDSQTTVSSEITNIPPGTGKLIS